MVTRFGSREICDVTFKALTNGMVVGTHTFNAGQPVFVIDTATTSSMEQATTTVYAQGGRGYNRLMSWEGEPHSWAQSSEASENCLFPSKSNL